MECPRIAAALVLLAAPMPLCATETEIGPGDDFRTAMENLHAGDTLILDGGTYSFSGYFELDLAGTSTQPIVIKAQAGDHPIIQYLGTDQNIVNINNSTFVTFDGIEFTGGSRGIRLIGGSDITVKNCHVHGTAANAIAANDEGYSYANLKFIHNEVDHTGDTGEAFYLGCNDDACRIHGSLVANNYIHDLNGPTISQVDGIEIKKGSYANIVQDNVIHDTGYPGITMYDVNGEGGPNLIQRNIVWNTGDNGMQVTADATLRNNIVLSAAAGDSAFASNNIQNGSAANLIIENNTFLMPNGNGIKLNAVTGAVTIANNAIYAPNGNAIAASGNLTQLTVVANAGQGTLNAGSISSGFIATGNLANDFFGASLSGTLPQNLIPKGSLLVGTANPAYLVSDDFDLQARNTHADIGAYRVQASGTPLWTIAPAFKNIDEIFADGFGP